MSRVFNVYNHMTMMPTAKGEDRLALEPAFLEGLTGRAVFSFCNGRMLVKPYEGRTYAGHIAIYYNGKLKEIPYTFKAGTKNARWNDLDTTETATEAIKFMSERYMLVMDPWAGYGIDFYFEDGPNFLTTDYLYWDVFLDFHSTDVKNIQIEGTTDTRNVIKINWSSSYQDAFEVNIIQNGVVVAMASGLKEKTISITPRTLQPGPFVVRLVTANNPVEAYGQSWGENFTNEATLTATSTAPTISNLKPNLTTHNVENPLTVTWDSTAQETFKVEFIQNDRVVHQITGTTAKTITVNPATLPIGNVTIKATAYNVVNNITASAEAITTFTAVMNSPEIYALEPYLIDQFVIAPITASWSSANQQNYELKVYSGYDLIKIYTGTTANQVVIPKDTLPQGAITQHLLISKTYKGVNYTAKMISNYKGIGTPNKPIFEDQSIYSQAQPLLKWSAQNQIAYKLEIYKQAELIETSGEIASLETKYQVKAALENNTTYTLKLKIKNQYDLWSEETAKDILISYTELPKPELTLVRDLGGILVTIIYPSNIKDLKSLEIWRKDKFSDFKRMAFNLKTTSQWVDNTVASGVEYIYKIRAMSKEGGISESNTKTESSYIKSFFFDNIESKERKTFEINSEIKIDDVVDRTVRVFAGGSKPKIEKGKTNYRRLSATFTVASSNYDDIKHFFDTGNVILYRDLKGAKFYGAITSPIPNTYLKGDKSVITFTFEEVNFLEKDLYSDMKLVLTYFNGAYFFDGSIDFSGVNLE